MKMLSLKSAVFACILAASPLLMACDSGAENESAGSSVEDSVSGGPEQLPVESDVPPPSRDVFVDATCDYESWVGQPLDEAKVKAEGRPYRIVKPGDPMTMDFRTDRINVEHKDNKVTRVWCG